MFNERTYAFGGSTLTLKFANILDSSAQVLVSSDDYMLSMGGGVSMAISRAAGSAMTLDALKSIPRRLGDVVVTTAGALDARYVFHLVTIGPQDSAKESPEEFVKRATARCLDLADALDVSSIAFPALGTGVAGIPMEASAAAMADAVCDRLTASTRQYDISLYLYARQGVDSHGYVAFFEEFARMRPRIASREAVTNPRGAPPRLSLPESAARLLELEQERQRLEHQIVMLKSHGDSSADRLNEALRLNQSQRLDAAARDFAARDKPVGVFISYAREDASFREHLVRHLSGLEQQGSVQTWTDREIHPGQQWDKNINREIESADVILFLVSAYSMSSSYIRGVEMARAFQRLEAGEVTVIPILARSYDLTDHRFSTLEYLPSDGRPIDLWPNEQDAYVDVVRGIRRAVQMIRARAA